MLTAQTKKLKETKKCAAINKFLIWFALTL